MAYSQQHAPTCCCGRMLSTVAVSYCYDGRGLYCNACGVSQSTGSVWHCSSGKTATHSRGYDLCLPCGTRQSQYQNRYQTTVNHTTMNQTSTNWSSLHGSKRMQLYHVTDKTGADGIKASGNVMKCGTSGKFGGGIYFAETIATAKSKALHRGYLVTAEVTVGRELQVQGSNTNFTRESLRSKGYDSVNATSVSERVVYSGDQVRVLSIQQYA